MIIDLTEGPRGWYNNADPAAIAIAKAIGLPLLHSAGTFIILLPGNLMEDYQQKAEAAGHSLRIVGHMPPEAKTHKTKRPAVDATYGSAVRLSFA